VSKAFMYDLYYVAALLRGSADAPQPPPRAESQVWHTTPGVAYTMIKREGKQQFRRDT
jgi:hypothetical protein